MKLRLMDDMEADDPIQSVVNLIDVFLVIIAALLLAVANNPGEPVQHRVGHRHQNPGKPNMEIVIKDGQKIERYKASGEDWRGQGNKAGVAYRLKDGSMVYVPEAGAEPSAAAGGAVMLRLLARVLRGCLATCGAAGVRAPACFAAGRLGGGGCFSRPAHLPDRWAPLPRCGAW